MEIELLKQGKFTTGGSSALKLMQNNNMPTLDLVVRESIQNSLDAALYNVNDVRVNFSYGEFFTNHFSKEFPSIEKVINEKINKEKSKFISISDCNTIGLTGDLSGNFKNGEKNQNLGKLVFHIMRAQDEEGAGGSWGIGKTVYYRMGIGFVVYYSRVKLDNGKFQERLVASLVEDETKDDGFLKDLDDNLGVAFFGEEISTNGIRAITNKEYIHKFLSIFNINPYSGSTTGTIIIVPFINEEKLIKNNLIEDSFGESLWWENNLKDYLRVSILRWYFPRMSKNYSYGPKLIASINMEVVKADKQTPVFMKYMELYDSVFSQNKPNWINKVDITRKSHMKSEIVGTFVYGKVNKNELGVISEHLPSPYQYAHILDEHDQENKPMIVFTRKPGMVVNYTIEGLPIGDVRTDKNEYILGVFVLNSKNSIISPNIINLDEYIRRSEKSDHTSWVDHPINSDGLKLLIVQNIYRQISKNLRISYGDELPVTGSASIEMTFARKFGGLLLPDDNFGNSGSAKKTNRGAGRTGGGIVISKEKNIIDFVGREFKSNKLFLDYEITIVSKISSITIKNMVNTVNGDIDPLEWENMSLKYPCSISAVAFKCLLVNTKKIDSDLLIIESNQENNKFLNYSISFLKTNNGNFYGIVLSNKFENKRIKFRMRIAIDIYDKLTQTNMVFDLKGDK